MTHYFLWYQFFLLTFCIKCTGSKFQTQVYMFFLSWEREEREIKNVWFYFWRTARFALKSKLSQFTLHYKIWPLVVTTRLAVCDCNYASVLLIPFSFLFSLQTKERDVGVYGWWQLIWQVLLPYKLLIMQIKTTFLGASTSLTQFMFLSLFGGIYYANYMPNRL